MDANRESKPVSPIQEQQIRALLNSEKGKMLASLFQQGGKDTLQKAAQAIRQGQTEEAKELLTPIVSSRQVQSLLQQLFGEDGLPNG